MVGRDSLAQVQEELVEARSNAAAARVEAMNAAADVVAAESARLVVV
jgi:hypothetical protein